ncbi:hypothetical protein Tco_1137669 [Tanacetum coccineum]
MDDPNITMEKYIRLEEEKSRRHGKVYITGKLLRMPTVSSLNNDEIDFRISFDESDDEDCTIVYTAYPNPMDMRYQYGVSWGMDMAYRLPVQF